MADPLSVGASVINVVTVTRESSKLLYDTIHGFRTHQTVVKRLSSELSDLNEILDSLHDHVRADAVPFVPLNVPLAQCNRACVDFKAIIDEFTEFVSPRARIRNWFFRDWLRLSYMKGDIEDFTKMLAGYGSTINIALADTNLRSIRITRHALNSYKGMIDDARHELRYHLSDMNHKLLALAHPSKANSESTAFSIEQVANEQEGIEECLKVCSQVLEQIGTAQFHVNPATGVKTTVTPQNLTRAASVTLFAFKECSTRINYTMRQLEGLKKITETDLDIQLTRAPRDLGADRDRDFQRLQGEVDSIRHRMEFFDDASERASSAQVLEEDESVDSDSQDSVVFTVDDLIRLKRRPSLPILRSISKPSLQQVQSISALRQALQEEATQEQQRLLESMRKKQLESLEYSKEDEKDESSSSGGGSPVG